MPKSYTEYMGEVSEAIDWVNQRIAHYGLAVTDLTFPNGASSPRATRKTGKPKVAAKKLPAAKKGRKQKVRFKGPNGEKWSGQGSTPRWITASGKDKEAFRI